MRLETQFKLFVVIKNILHLSWTHETLQNTSVLASTLLNFNFKFISWQIHRVAVI